MGSTSDRPDYFHDLSIVIQGPAELGGRPVAALAAQTAKRAFPGAEVIVSCWDGDHTETIGLLADCVVTSPDPGPQRHSKGVLNVNRQIVSSRAGLEVATRTFMLKARSDLIFHSARLWSEYLAHRRHFRSVYRRDPILITNLTTVNPRRQERYFALCDWIYLGPRDAMAELFTTPPFPDEHLAYLVRGEPVLRYNAEQWITINFLARHGLNLDTLSDGYVSDPATVHAYRAMVGRHFAMSSWFRLGLSTQKHHISSFSLDNMYTHREWAEEFLDRRSLLDPERIVLSVAYHPMVRAAVKRLQRSLVA